jgi:DNA invertase Pin-like site-specific DNA recombinase
MRYLLYSRVSPKGSSWDGNETSCADQLRQCREFVLSRDKTAEFLEITDEMYSAKDLHRPGIARAIDDLRHGRAQWDALVVRHLDRLTRSLTDALPLISLLQQHGKGLVSVTQALDLSGPTGRAMLNIILVFGQWEREMLAERVRGRMVGMAKDGLWVTGTPPVGYKRAGKGNNILVIDPTGAEMVRDIFRSYARGESVPGIARRHKTYGQKISGILSNRAYLGRLIYAGTEVEGKHPPLITEAEFDAAAARRPKPGSGSTHPGAQKYPYLLAGMVRCDCGKIMSGNSTGTRRKTATEGDGYHYYRCVNGCNAAISAEELETMVLDMLSAQKISGSVIDTTIAKLEQSRGKEAGATAEEIASIAAAIAEHKKTMDRIKKAYLAGASSKIAAALNADYDHASNEIERLEEHRKLLLSRRSADDSQMDAAIQMAKNMIDIAKKLEIYRKSGNTAGVISLIQSCIDHIQRQEDGSFELVPTFAAFRATNKVGNPAWSCPKFTVFPRKGWRNRHNPLPIPVRTRA